MTDKEFKDARAEIFNQMTFQLQLGLLLVATYGDFYDIFEIRLREKTGRDFTPEDEQWVIDAFDRFEKAIIEANERQKKKKSSKKEH